jgi:hypothetical protein
MFTFSTYRRCLALGALVLACCAMLAPAASAMIPDRHHGTTTEGPAQAILPSDMGYYTHDVGATASDAGLTATASYGALYQFPSAGIVAESAPVRPDDRATHGIGATAADVIATGDGLISRPAPADNIVAAGGAPVVPAAEPVSGTGFDWSDAGVGIVLGVLCAMLLGGLLLLSRRRGTLSGA